MMLFRSMLIVMVACLFAGTPAPAQNLNGVFDEAIDYAQARMVKVYGATAGRVDGYSSGIIVSPDGLIITMQGVYLDGMNTRVTMHDGTRYPATVLRRERSLQLALLKIEAETPEYFELSSEDVGGKGDWVVALSNAFKVADGVEPMSVNLGIISLRTTIEARLSPRDVAYRGPLVLIDCITSNPGAGGGAIVTEDKRLVGSIGRVINSSDTNTRLNYAVPAAVLKAFAEGNLQLQAESPVVASDKPADLGVRLFRMSGRRAPAYIDRVINGSPASEVGLRPDDLVISLNGERIGSIREFVGIMETSAPGQEVIIIVKRKQLLIRVPITPVEKQ